MGGVDRWKYRSHVDFVSFLVFPQEVNQLNGQIAGSAVTVEIDAPKTQDLGKIMADIRGQYDVLAQKNREDAEKWYQSKVRKNERPYNIYFS